MSDFATYRISGITDNNAPLSIKQTEQLKSYAMDLAGNIVECIPTITTAFKLDEKTFEDLVKKSRALSPCPCKSKECEEDYQKEKIKFETLLGKETSTLPHASAIHYYKAEGTK
jgi:hypothetical protein